MSKVEGAVELFRARIGETEGPGEWHEVDQSQINLFADATGDHQFIHVDPEKCAELSPYKVPIAHGFLTLSLLPRMGGRSEREPEWTLVGQGNVVNYGSDKFRFLAPVPSGSVLHSRSRLLDVEATPKGTRLVREIAVHVVGSDRPSLVYHMIVLYQPPRT